MKMKLNIRQKITVFILGGAIAIFFVTIGYFAISTNRVAYRNSIEFTNTHTDHYAAMVENMLNSDMAIARTLSSVFLEHKQVPFEKWQEMLLGMYKKLMITNPHIDAVWDSWEFSYLDPAWDKPHGRWLQICYREKGKLLTKMEKRSLDKDPPVYASLKVAGHESIVEPYLSTLQVGGLMTSLASPMYVQGKYLGLIGLDLFLGRFQNLICDIKPYPESQAFLLSNQGTFVAHPDTALFKKNINDALPKLNEREKVTERVKKGDRFNFTFIESNGERYYYTFSPIKVGQTQTPWSLGIVVPERVILAESNHNFNVSLIVGIVGILVLVIIIIVLANNITKPINSITFLLEELAMGKVDKSMHIEINTGDEISQMSSALSKSIDGLLTKTEFAASIGKGELNAELTLLSQEDILGKSLIEMRDSLRRAQQEELTRKEIEAKRQWTNEGLAKFGDILRQNNDNLNRLGDEVVKNLVWYLKASLGGLFVRNENGDSDTLELVSAFAYDRKRFLMKSFKLGDGLIGTCALEKETIYLTELPQDYIEVTSGLGDANPSAILLIPLKIEEDVLGVIELASLNKFLPHEIELCEKLAESIASTLRTVRINNKTNELLRKSQEQTEIMVSQEEEMRQNMEELQATQEEAARKTFEMEGLISALNASTFVMEYDEKGNIISINDSYLGALGIKREDAIGHHHSENLVMTDDQKMTYEQFWSNLRRGQIQKQTTRVNMHGKEFLFLETYTPIRNANGEVYKVLKVATDITSTI
jgi:PAS domain S-box-containing protein